MAATNYGRAAASTTSAMNCGMAAMGTTALMNCDRAAAANCGRRLRTPEQGRWDLEQGVSEIKIETRGIEQQP
jgi:hypothetical protein